MGQPVFISHSSLDKATADTVCRFLEAQGIACWIAPRNVPPGAKYGEAIVHAIENALALVLIFSEHSNASEQVLNDTERSVTKKNRPSPSRSAPSRHRQNSNTSSHAGMGSISRSLRWTPRCRN